MKDNSKFGPLENMRARAEQVRRLVGMTDDPEMAMNLRCCAAGLNAEIDRLAGQLDDQAHPRESIADRQDRAA
ncbi:MAG: hypothetical protein ACJ8EH_01715 [Sphingomicrobium sp.]